MKTAFTSCILAAICATSVEAIRLGETQIVKIIPDEYDLAGAAGGPQGKELVDVAMPLIQHVLEKEDDDSVKEIVRNILNKETKPEKPEPPTKDDKPKKPEKPAKVMKDEKEEEDNDNDNAKVVVIVVNGESDDEEEVVLVAADDDEE